MASPQKPTYWLDLFTYKTWQEFLDKGGNVSGFSENRWGIVKKIKEGDFLLCYLTGVSRFCGLLEVTSEPYQSNDIIWKDNVYPARVKVKVIYKLEVEYSVPVYSILKEFSFYSDDQSKIAWTGRFRGSPAAWKTQDAHVVVEALKKAVEEPTFNEVDRKKLLKRPKPASNSTAQVIIPVEEVEKEKAPGKDKESSLHTEIQYLLGNLGYNMGFKIWIARNDRNRIYQGKKLCEHFQLIEELPVQFDMDTQRTIEYIDVLWLKSNSIVSAFEVESTTSIYSGLLRMSDLLAMQPNIHIPLYLVAPDDRRDKVIEEINRPTFSRFSPPIVDVCRFISFERLKQKIESVRDLLPILKVEFLDYISEDCIVVN